MKRGYVSFLVLLLAFSVFGFANYPVIDGKDNFTGWVGKTVGNSRSEWKVSLRFGAAYYGIVDETNYKAVGTLTDAGASSIDDSSNYNSVFKTCTKLQLFADDSLYLVAQNGGMVFQFYVQRSGWRRLCSLTTTMLISRDYIKAVGTELYILANNNLYKVPHVENSTALTGVITDVSITGFNYIGGKIWYTTSNSLVQCDLDGSNRQTVRTGSHYTDIDAFAISLLDTSIVYRRPDAKYELYFDRGGSVDQVCNLPGSVGDSATDFRVDANNDIWFTYINTIAHKLYKYDVDDNLLTKYLPSNTHSLTAQQNFRMTSDLGTIVFVGEGDSVWFHMIDHKPRFQLVYNIDSVGYINDGDKEIIYSCTLGVVDDNSSNFTYSKIGSTPSWINLNSSFGDSVVITADRATAIDTGTYTIQIMVEDDFAVSPMTDTFTTTFKVYPRQIVISSDLDSSSTEDVQYSMTINLFDGDNDSAFVNQYTIPSWLTLSRLSEKSFKLEGTPDEDKVDTIVNIIFTDSSSGNEPVLGEAYGFSYDTASFNLDVQGVNDAPVINSSAVTSATEGIAYSYDVIASDVDGDTDLKFFLPSILIYPDGMIIADSSEGIITWTPDYDDAGSYSIKVYVTDGAKNGTQTYTLTVNNTNRAPVIGNVTDTTVDITEGDTLTLTLHAIDPDGDNLSFSSTTFDAIIRTDSVYKIVPNHNSIDTVFLIVSDSDLSDTCRVILNVQAKVGIINNLVELPKINSLTQNFPNPFNPITSIKYSVANENRVDISIFDMHGRMINRIVSQKQQVGYYTAVWNGLDSHGKGVHSGTYIYRIRIGNNFSKQMLMTLIK